MKTNQYFSKIHIAIILAVFSIIIVQPSYGVQRKKTGGISKSLGQLRSQIDKILKADELSSGFAGIKVVSLEDGNIIYERNSTKLFHPASNAKLLTTATALAKLPGFHFRTKLYTDNRIKNETLSGNVYIKGSGDPLLVSADLDSLAGMIEKRGIKSITGNIVGDISYFDTVAWGAGWMWDDEPSSDEPFITPLSVDSNSIHFTIDPGAVEGTKVSYVVEPLTEEISVQCNARTTKDTVGFPLKPNRRKGTNDFTIEGAIAPGATEYKNEYSVWKPELLFLHLFRDDLRKRGIVWHGECIIDTIHQGTLVGEIDHSIDSALIRINKMSYNLGAENLLKALGAEAMGAPGTFQSGLRVVKDYLTQVGIDTTDIILVDGSGVSMYNLFSPADMIRLLRAEYKSRNNFERFYATLPIAGVDGTLKNRMKGTHAEGNVRAKTGSLTGTSALSGYVTTADQKLLAFSIMNNHFPGESKAIREVQNRILELLAEYRNGN